MEIEKTGNSAKKLKTTENGGVKLADGTLLSVREIGDLRLAYSQNGATQNSLSKSYDIPIGEMNKIIKSTANRHPDF